MKRSFVVIGQSATASPHFSLVDIAGTSGRLDVLLRCVRSALLVSHGLRRDTSVYLVLLGGPLAPRVLRLDGQFIRFVRPDERALAVLVQKALTRASSNAPPGVFETIRAGLAVASGGLDAVLRDLRAGRGDRVPPSFLLEEHAHDIRDAALPTDDLVIFVGDHHGFDEATRAELDAFGAVPIGVGPVSVHADDAITLVCNELDRRRARLDAARTDARA